ncbi:protein distal antenna-like [Belonocnema kinseyi]|uniref:protein distal antenna-like n=1 Tax=Belonocnema kinseyi TaxID=2817044 RepID=UPI00143D259B|nr:protein distal antenna-like [Belonocnema kinseyi]
MDLSIKKTEDLSTKKTEFYQRILEDIQKSVNARRARSCRVKRSLKSPAEKIEAIERVKNGERKSSVARDIGIPESTLRGWCKSVEKIQNMANTFSPESMAHSPALSSEAHEVIQSSDDEAPPLKKLRQNFQQPTNYLEEEKLFFQHLELTSTHCHPNPRKSSINKKRIDESPWMTKLLSHHSETEDAPKSVAEAIKHGEQFFKWIDECSDPSERVKFKQFKFLLDNMKTHRNERDLSELKWSTEYPGNGIIFQYLDGRNASPWN